MAEIKFKIVVIGDAAVGKTSLIRKYTKGDFQEDYIATLGAQFTQYEEKIEDVNLKFIFWDIAGQEIFEQMRKKFYSGTKGAIIVFSHSSDEQNSFRRISKWLSEIRKYCGKIQIALFGNKIDLVNEEELRRNENLDTSDLNVERYVRENDFLGYYKTSALTGQGVYDAFRALAKRLYSLGKF
ncbi:MAG: Rab family GTPase [Candidatus Hodarchaeota archaeon]